MLLVVEVGEFVAVTELKSISDREEILTKAGELAYMDYSATDTFVPFKLNERYNLYDVSDIIDNYGSEEDIDYSQLDVEAIFHITSGAVFIEGTIDSYS